MADKHINIKFPIQENPLGFYLDSNTTTKDSIKSDILHVLLTRKGDRFFDPEFGTNLYTYLFEPNDEITVSGIKREANECLSYAMPNIKIEELSVEQSGEDGNTINLRIIAVDTDDVYLQPITIEVVI